MFKKAEKEEQIYLKKVIKVMIPRKSSPDLSFNLLFFYIYILCLSSVCLYPINVLTAETIGPNFLGGPPVTLGKVYEWSNFQKYASNKIQFLTILKIHEFFFLIWEFFILFLFYNVYKEKMFTIEIDDRREAP